MSQEGWHYLLFCWLLCVLSLSLWVVFKVLRIGSVTLDSNKLCNWHADQSSGIGETQSHIQRTILLTLLSAVLFAMAAVGFSFAYFAFMFRVYWNPSQSNDVDARDVFDKMERFFSISAALVLCSYILLMSSSLLRLEMTFGITLFRITDIESNVIRGCIIVNIVLIILIFLAIAVFQAFSLARLLLPLMVLNYTTSMIWICGRFMSNTQKLCEVTDRDNIDSMSLLNGSVRLTISTSIALITFLISMFGSLLWLMNPHSVGLEIIHEMLWTGDSLCNLYCLLFSLKLGKSYYHFFLGSLHRYLLKLLVERAKSKQLNENGNGTGDRITSIEFTDEVQ